LQYVGFMPLLAFAAGIFGLVMPGRSLKFPRVKLPTEGRCSRS
jgi:hypothetical protein